MRKTGKFLAGFWKEEDGAAAAEYALLLAIIAAGMALAAANLGTSIENVLNNTVDCIEKAGQGNCPKVNTGAGG